MDIIDTYMYVRVCVCVYVCVRARVCVYQYRSIRYGLDYAINTQAGWTVPLIHERDDHALDTQASELCPSYTRGLNNVP